MFTKIQIIFQVTRNVCTFAFRNATPSEKKLMKRLLTIPIIIALILAINIKSFSQNTRKIDIALCLDLSASTNGLIDKFREAIWQILNETNKLSPTPEIRIGLVAYGRPSYGRSSYFVKVMSDLTDDVDGFYEGIIGIHAMIEAGESYVGKAMECTINKMSWSKDPDALKFIFLIGNGPVNMGGMDYQDQSDFAVSKGIFLTPVFVKNYLKPSEEMGWEKIAQLAKTNYEQLNINKKLQQIPTSFDEDVLKELNKVLDSTYLYYGQNGKSRYKFMQNLDNDAARISLDCFQERIAYKSSPSFQMKQSSWDLVDWSYLPVTDYDLVNNGYLPEKLQNKSDEDLRRIVRATRYQRAQAIKSIKEISQKRQQVIATKSAQLKINNNDTFAGIIINTIKRIAGQNGFTALN